MKNSTEVTATILKRREDKAAVERKEVKSKLWKYMTPEQKYDYVCWLKKVSPKKKRKR